MERDDLIEYSLHGHHEEATGKSIRQKIYKVTLLLTVITVVEVFNSLFAFKSHVFYGGML